MVVPFQSEFGESYSRQPTEVFAADLILNQFQFGKSSHRHFWEACVYTHRSVALKDPDSIDFHWIDCIKLLYALDALDEVWE